jgi:Clp amino terminal domain, pathogenicity island component
MSSDPIELQELIEFIEGKQRASKPLDQLTEAAMLSDRFAAMADDLVGHFVDHAREQGASWAEVGAAIGVSKQAAQKRFVDVEGKGWSRKGLFMRFATGARTVVVATQEIARSRGDDHIGTEHLLLGLLDDEGSMAARALASFGVTKDLVDEAIGSAPGPKARVKGHIPFSPDAKKVLELALREAIRVKARSIGTEHILLAILRASDSPGARILDRFGVTHRWVEAWLAEAA